MIDYEALTRRGQIRCMRQVAERVLPLYDIKPITVALLHHAYNTTFKVTGPDGARYVLHIPRPLEDIGSEAQWRARIRSELWWLDRVRNDLHLTAPVPMCTPEGESVVTVHVEGVTPDRVCTLFHWVDGGFVRRRFSSSQLEAVGRLTAQLHHHSETLHVPAEFERPKVDRADIETEERVAHLFADSVSIAAASVMRSVFRRMREAQHRLGNSPDAFGIIHADIHQKNYLFRCRKIRLIDFGDCGWGHYLYDLAVTLSELESLPNYGQLRVALLAGYRHMRDLSPSHEALIDIFVMLREVQNLTWYVTARGDPSYRERAAQIEERVTVLEKRAGAGT